MIVKTGSVYNTEKTDNDSLIIVMPAYNEAENIEAVIRDWYPVIGDKKEGSKLIIDCSESSDNTLAIIRSLQGEFPNLCAITDTVNSYRNKILALYDYAVNLNPDFIFQTDSDGQTNPADFPDFWKDRNNFDAIIGARKKRGDGRLRLLVEKIECFMILVLCRVKVPDANTPFRLMKTDYLKTALQEIPRNYSMPNIVLTIHGALSKYRICFKNIGFISRQGGKNIMNFKRIFQIGKESVNTFSSFAGFMKKRNEL